MELLHAKHTHTARAQKEKTMQDRLMFIPEDGEEPVEFYIVEETKLAGNQYVLVTDTPDGDGEALILRARLEAAAQGGDGADDHDQSMYEIVEDEQELSAVLLMMRDALEELGIEILE